MSRESIYGKVKLNMFEHVQVDLGGDPCIVRWSMALLVMITWWPPLWTDRQTNTTENIAFLQLRWRAVKIFIRVVRCKLIFSHDHGCTHFAGDIFTLFLLHLSKYFGSQWSMSRSDFSTLFILRGVGRPVSHQLRLWSLPELIICYIQLQANLKFNTCRSTRK